MNIRAILKVCASNEILCRGTKIQCLTDFVNGGTINSLECDQRVKNRYKMKKGIITTILVMVGFGSLYSQNLTDSLFVDFFDKTFNDYFGNAVNRLEKQFNDTSAKVFYILKDSVPENVKIDYPNFKLKLVDYSQAYPLIKKRKMTSLYWARNNIISADSVDIVIGGWSTEFKRVFRFPKINGKRKLILGNYNFGAWCGGTLGYIPQGRFIFESKLKKWKYLTENEVINEKIEMQKIDNK